MCMLPQKQYHEELLAPLGEVTVAMERHGVPFDVPAARELLKRVQADFDATSWKLTEWYAEVDAVGPEMPPNWNSAPQLQYFLYTPCGLNLPPALFWKKGATGWEEGDDGEYKEEWEGEGQFKTDDVALQWLAAHHPEVAPILQLIRDWRWQKRVITYLNTWIAAALWRPDPECSVGGWWWLHPSFGLANDKDERAGAITGRFAIKNPALQQVPSRDDEYELRKLFKAPPGYSWVVCDYSQLEIVILAHLCAKLFGTHGLADRMALDDKGEPLQDMHSLTCKYILGEVLGDAQIKLLDVKDVKKHAKLKREITKTLRYGLNYGKGKYGFGNTLFLEDGSALGEDRAEKMILALYEFDPEIPQYQDWMRTFIERYEMVVSLLGRFCLLPLARRGSRSERNRAWRRALNYPMQAGGQEVTAAAMIAAFKDAVLKSLGFRLMLQVHDELCGLVRTENAPAARDRLRYIMCNTIILAAQLAASGGIGDSWGQAK
jgi:hypothetical protein